MLESWGCGLYTSAAYTRVFTVVYNMPNKLKIYKSSSKHHAFVTKNPAYMDNH